MNAYEQLLEIKDMLVDAGANEQTLEIVEQYITKMEPTQHEASNVPLSVMLRHLARSKEVLNSFEAERDILDLQGELEAKREDEDVVRSAWEEVDNKPKPKSYYKDKKEAEKAGKKEKKSTSDS